MTNNSTRHEFQVGYATAPCRLALTGEQIERLERALEAFENPFLLGALAAVNIEPFVSIPVSRLPPGATRAVTSSATWVFGAPVDIGDPLVVQTRVVGHRISGGREFVDLETAAKLESGAHVLSVGVSLSWKLRQDLDSVFDRQSMPRTNDDIQDSRSLTWSSPLKRSAVSALFEARPDLEMNPHASQEAARTYGFPSLLVSAPHLGCLIMAGLFNSGPQPGTEVSLHFLKPVLAGDEIALERLALDKRRDIVRLWSRSQNVASLCVKGTITRNGI